MGSKPDPDGARDLAAAVLESALREQDLDFASGPDLPYWADLAGLEPGMVRDRLILAILGPRRSLRRGPWRLQGPLQEVRP